jgi:DNA-binding FrmR family transcriptional regulator
MLVEGRAAAERGKTVAHTIREKTKLLARVRRIRGQVEAIERSPEAEIGCADVLQVIASVRGAMNGLMAELMEDHIRFHVVDPAGEPNSERARGAQELIDVVRTYLK